MDSPLTRFRSRLQLSTLSSLQLFQLARYSGFVLTGLSFAKLGIAKSEIGRFETFVWWMGLFSFFWIAGLMNSMLASYPRQTEEGKRHLLFTTFCLILLLSGIAGAVQWVAGGSVLGLAYLLLNNASYVIEYILFLQDHRSRLIIYGVMMAIVQWLLCVVPAYMHEDIQYAIYGLILTAAIKFIYIVSLLRQHTLTKFQWLRIRQLFLLSTPLMLSFFVNGSAEYIDGAVVQHYFSLGDFSVFRYGSREFPLFTILSATLSMSMIPRVSEDLPAGLQAIRQESVRYMHFFFPMAIVFILSGQWLFTTFFSPQFAESGRIFAGLMLLTIPRLLFPQTILTALGESRLILVCAIFEMLINIFASILLVKPFGLVGVAYGTVIAFVSEKMLMILILYYKNNISPFQYISPLPFSLYAILTIVSYMISLHF